MNSSGKSFLSDKEAEAMENWDLQEMGWADDESKKPNVFGYEADWFQKKNEPVEEVIQPEEPKPLTLEEIEAIRQAAYDDGFAEGKQAGFDAGHQEGAEKGHQEGEAAGRLEGYQAGFEQGEGAARDLAGHWQDLLDHLARPMAQFDHQIEQQLVWMVMQLSKVLLRTEPHLSADLLLATLKEGVSQLPMAEEGVTIELHPDDVLLVQSAYSPEVCAKRNWTLQPEPALQRGDVILRSSSSSIDMLLEQRIEQLMKQFIQKNLELLS